MGLNSDTRLRIKTVKEGHDPGISDHVNKPFPPIQSCAAFFFPLKEPPLIQTGCACLDHHFLKNPQKLPFLPQGNQSFTINSNYFLL